MKSRKEPKQLETDGERMEVQGAEPGRSGGRVKGSRRWGRGGEGGCS